MKKRIRYRRGPHSISVSVEDPDPHCAACGEEAQGRRRNTHHWKEEYTFEEVKSNPPLALKNSIQVDVTHHHAANAIREIIDWIKWGHITVEQVHNLIDTLPDDMRATWDEVCPGSA